MILFALFSAYLSFASIETIGGFLEDEPRVYGPNEHFLRRGGPLTYVGRLSILKPPRRFGRTPAPEPLPRGIWSDDVSWSVSHSGSDQTVAVEVRRPAGVTKWRLRFDGVVAQHLDVAVGPELTRGEVLDLPLSVYEDRDGHVLMALRKSPTRVVVVDLTEGRVFDLPTPGARS